MMKKYGFYDQIGSILCSKDHGIDPCPKPIKSISLLQTIYTPRSILLLSHCLTQLMTANCLAICIWVISVSKCL